MERELSQHKFDVTNYENNFFTSSMQEDFDKFKKKVYRANYHPYTNTIGKERNSISCSGAKNLKLLREQGKLAVSNSNEGSGFTSKRDGKQGKSKDFLDMVNVEKVIFKEELYTQAEDAQPNNDYTESNFFKRKSL